MSLFTNDKLHGGSFKEHLTQQIKHSSEIVIASGYVSKDVISDFTPAIKRAVKNNGTFNLIVGMAFFEGTSATVKKALIDLHETIHPLGNSDSGVKLVWKRRFHGKVYYFKQSESEKLYVGSSNFSSSGLANYIETTILVDNEETFLKTRSFIDYLNSEELSVYIDKVQELPVIDSSPFRDKVIEAKIESTEARRHDTSTINLAGVPFIDISFERVDKQEKSNLNTYFGEGRWSRKTGKVIPRNWFEVEIISSKSEQNNPLYPRGVFTAITDDEFEFQCSTHGDNYKNLRSKHKLEILGKWIKKKLQDSGALKPLTPVTLETLDSFGTKFLRLYRLSEDVYYMEFKPDDERYKQQ